MADYFFESQPNYSDEDSSDLELGDPCLSSQLCLAASDESLPLAQPSQAQSSRRSRTPMTSNFRVNAKGFFLTFPQTTTTKESAFENLRASPEWERLKWCVISQETHADGNTHLHVILYYQRKRDIRSPLFFDFIANSHGNVQALRSVYNAIKYLHKEDKNPIAHGIDCTAVLKRQSGQAAWVAQQIVEGNSTIAGLLVEESGFMLMNLKRVEYFHQAFTRATSLSRPKEPVTFELSQGGIESASIVQWLRDNIRQTRAFKQNQLWISSPPNHGKTSIFMELSEVLSIYWPPISETFDDLYEDDAYDLVVFDEFKGQRSITFMNSFVQGGPMVIRRKGSQYLKKQNIPVVVLSNFTIEEAYGNCTPQQLAPLVARFTQVSLSQFIKINHSV